MEYNTESVSLLGLTGRLEMLRKQKKELLAEEKAILLEIKNRIGIDLTVEVDEPKVKTLGGENGKRCSK